MYKIKQSVKSWEKIILKYEESNLCKSDFCKELKISTEQFYYWCNKLRPDLKSEKHLLSALPKKSDFLPIKTTIKNEGFSIKINSNMVIKFDELPEPNWMANLINSIGKQYDQY